MEWEFIHRLWAQVQDSETEKKSKQQSWKQYRIEASS